MATTTLLECKNLRTPDETRESDHGIMEVVHLHGPTVTRSTLQPGWRWSSDIAPKVGTTSCQVTHTGYVMSGRMHVRMDDGSETDLGPGDAFRIDPGHDAWVVGDEPCVNVDVAMG